MSPELEKRSRKYLIFRLLIILTGLGLVTFYQMSLGPVFGENTFRYLYVLLGVYLLLGVGLLVFYPRWRRYSRFLRWQVVVDFVIQSLLIWGTGGVLSIFSPLLFVTLVAATTVISARGAFILATIATAFLTTTTVASALGISPVSTPEPLHWFRGGKSSVFIVSYLLASVLALYTISALGSRFSHGLRSVQGMQSEILENMAEGLIAVDRSGTVVHLNKEARKLLGLGEAGRRRQPFDLGSVFPTPRYAELREAFEGAQRRRLNTVIGTPDGKERPVEVKISSVTGDVGELRFRIGLIADLTLKREIEAAERRIQKLEELHVMALGIAHEIRNPLASIRGCVQEIGRLCRDQPGVTGYMQIVCRESDRLDGTLEEFLRYARSGPIDLAPMDLTEAIDEAVVLLRARPDIGSRVIRWAPPDRSPRIFGDHNSLIQVFLNLGLNAIEASSAEKGEIVFEVRPKVFAAFGRGVAGKDLVSGVEVEIRDNGHGLSRHDSGKIFTPFFTTKENGSGLGLCIVQRIVRDHLGVVDFCSREGEGTAFRIWLPLISRAPDVEAPSHARDPERQEPAECGYHERMRAC